jgi:hypothetical protein
MQPPAPVEPKQEEIKMAPAQPRPAPPKASAGSTNFEEIVQLESSGQLLSGDHHIIIEQLEESIAKTKYLN